MTVLSRTEARQRVAALSARFAQNRADFMRATYNETQARTDFITPLLGCFGWDVHNAAGLPLAFREVVEEATVEVGEERLSKRPDYELRLARQRKLFVEAKKPSVRVDRDRAPAFQVRRYGYSGGLPISILTNFDQLAIYDCRTPPADTDEAHVARLCLVRYDEFEARFDELWDMFSREFVYSGAFDERQAAQATRHGAEPFDDLFLRQVRSWRERLAADIHANAPTLSASELTYAAQLFLSRIVFLRICEDRDIERYESLRELPAAGAFAALMVALQRADTFYNSGLFRLLDDAPLGVRISDDLLLGLIEELYYPQSPYTFAVVETEVLGEIYEQFLGEEIVVTAAGIEITYKPEVRESGGVVSTPRFIVDRIVAQALLPALAGRSPADLGGFTVLDPCCGSGVFLLVVFEFLQAHYLDWYQSHDPASHPGAVYEVVGGNWRLTVDEKRRILTRHIRGVDVDPNAVEVARFSLLLKLIEDESRVALDEFVERTHERALPALDGIIRSGNSLVRRREWATVGRPMPQALAVQVNPFDWEDEFPAEAAGFDVIVANPPYTRIQNMAAYSPSEMAFYKAPNSPYATARQDNFDKYALFVERTLTLLAEGGRMGLIIPNKFMQLQSGRALRRLLTDGSHLSGIVNFGSLQVFAGDAANYTCLLFAQHSGSAEVEFEQVTDLTAWRYGQRPVPHRLPIGALGPESWATGGADTREVIASLRARHPRRLVDVAEINVGLQTSADAIYIFKATAEDADSATLRWNGRDWPIEKGILRPCLDDVSLVPFGRPEANAWMIFPYELIPGPRRVQARVIGPTKLRRQFPRAMRYLEARRAELEKRAITGGAEGEQQFYQFGRSQSLIKFADEHIIVRVLTKAAQNAISDGSLVFTGGGNGPYYMVRPKAGSPEPVAVLLAFLNHPISEALIRTNTSAFRGGYYSHGRQFIGTLPIPELDQATRANIERLSREMIAATAAAVAARTPHQKTPALRHQTELKRQLEAAVTAAFGVTDAELQTLLAIEPPAS